MLETRFGEFRLHTFTTVPDGEKILALVFGGLPLAQPPLVRIHSQCLTGDAFGSLRCDCGQQLERALENIRTAGQGLLIYQMQEGRGIGLMNKLRAYELQDGGLDTVDANLRLGFRADHRTYALCASVLRYFEISRVRLLSNNPAKIQGLEAEGILVERVSLLPPPSPASDRYLRTKRERLGHLLDTPPFLRAREAAAPERPPSTLDDYR